MIFRQHETALVLSLPPWPNPSSLMFLHLLHELLKFLSLPIILIGTEALHGKEVVAGIQEMIDLIIFLQVLLG